VSKASRSKWKGDRKLPHVCAVYDVTGEEDSFIIAKFKNREELSNFAKEVLSPPARPNGRTRTVVLNTNDGRLSKARSSSTDLWGP